MAHPHKSDHESGLKGKVHKMVGNNDRQESPYQKATRIAGKAIDKLPMAKPEENYG